MSPRPPSRWPGLTALAVALAALVVAILAWFRPAPPPPPGDVTFTEQQVADAKTRACDAFALVKQGITLQTKGEPGDDIALRKAQSANAQLSLVAGGWYLRDQLDRETPQVLAKAAKELSTDLIELGVEALAGAQSGDPDQIQLSAETDSLAQQIESLCNE